MRGVMVAEEVTEAGTYGVGQGGVVVSEAVTVLSGKTQSKTRMCMLAF